MIQCYELRRSVCTFRGSSQKRLKGERSVFSVVLVRSPDLVVVTLSLLLPGSDMPRASTTDAIVHDVYMPPKSGTSELF